MKLGHEMGLNKRISIEKILNFITPNMDKKIHQSLKKLVKHDLFISFMDKNNFLKFFYVHNIQISLKKIKTFPYQFTLKIHSKSSKEP